MTTSEQMAHRLREVISDGKWIADTNYKEQLSSVTLEEALTRVSGLNSIAALTFHISYYITGVLQYFREGKLEIRDKYSFDLPPLDTDEDWDRLRQKLWDDTESFAREVEALSDDDLLAIFVDEKYGNVARSIDGTIEHCYYHLGQITLIRKLLKEEQGN